MPGRTLPIAAAALMGLVALGDLATTSSVAAGQSRSEKDIEEIVRNYLLENPEIIFEAAERYRDKQEALAKAAAEEAARVHLAELRSTPGGHIVTPVSGKTDVILIEFFDYNCGVCRTATDFVFDVMESEDNLETIFLELPVTNSASRGPALASLSVAGTDDYLRFHREVMNAPGLVDSEVAQAVAANLGLPESVISSALLASDTQDLLHDRLDRSIDIANDLGIDGTPAFLIATTNGEFVRMVSGYYPDEVRAAIDEARKITKG